MVEIEMNTMTGIIYELMLNYHEAQQNPIDIITRNRGTKLTVETLESLRKVGCRLVPSLYVPNTEKRTGQT